MRRTILLLSTALLSSVFLLGCQFCLYDHTADLTPACDGLELAIETAYAEAHTGLNVDSGGSLFLPLTGIPELDIAKALLDAEGLVSAAENLGLSITDSTATCEVVKNKYIPFKVHEEKRWFVFSTGK